MTSIYQKFKNKIKLRIVINNLKINNISQEIVIIQIKKVTTTTTLYLNILVEIKMMEAMETEILN